jgi:hypothetical protein
MRNRAILMARRAVSESNKRETNHIDSFSVRDSDSAIRIIIW